MVRKNFEQTFIMASQMPKSATTFDVAGLGHSTFYPRVITVGHGFIQQIFQDSMVIVRTVFWKTDIVPTRASAAGLSPSPEKRLGYR